MKLRQALRPCEAHASVPEELQLIARIVAGETELFHELVKPSSRVVFCVCLSVLRNREDAEDAAQETMLKALKNLHRFRAESKFSTWLVAIALNEARSRLPDRRVTTIDSLESPDGERLNSPHSAAIRDQSATPLEMLERKEMRHALRVALAALPEAYRQVLLLRKAEELSTAKTAALLRVNTGVVKIRLLRARLMTRKKLSSQFRARLEPTLHAGVSCASWGD